MLCDAIRMQLELAHSQITKFALKREQAVVMNRQPLETRKMADTRRETREQAIMQTKLLEGCQLAQEGWQRLKLVPAKIQSAQADQVSNERRDLLNLIVLSPQFRQICQATQMNRQRCNLVVVDA